jgi:MFS transporter, ACS family, tartrate transporter
VTDVAHSAAAAELESRTIARVRRRLIPFLCLLYLVAYLDRVNVGFAALQMNTALGISDSLYAFGAAIFFIGYFLFEVPSNLMLQRVGARIWIARIVLVWGLVSASMMFIVGPRTFCSMRFLLGAAEAGFFPGVIFYLSHWFPARHRGKAVAQFATASMFAGILGAPLSGALLSLRGFGGLDGWQWLFLLEGIPAILLGFVVLRYLTERPEDAHWLPEQERDWLVATMRAEQEHGVGGAKKHVTLSAGLLNPEVWRLTAIYFFLVVCAYGFNFWVPQIVKGLSGASDFQVGALTAIPYLVAAIGMVVVAGSSDRRNERRWHVAGSAVVASLGFAASMLLGSPVLAFGALCVAALGTFSATPPFWSLPTAFLKGTAAAAGIALINSVGNLGGFAGPYLVGLLKAATGDFKSGLLLLAAAPIMAALLVLTVPVPASAERAVAPRPE